MMNTNIAYCGLACHSCPIHLATLEKNPAQQSKMRVSIAEQLARIYKTTPKPEIITDCDGCKVNDGRLFTGCIDCEIRKCAIGKNMINCAYCSYYACDKLRKHFAIDPGAQDRLDEIRRKNLNSYSDKYPVKKYPTIGVCGLDCGLCPRYYTVGSSRCPGCCGPDFFNKHPTCSFITCCVKKKNLEVCAECPDFPCSKFKSDKDYQPTKVSSSYPPYKKVIPNLVFIKDYGIEKFMEQQKERIRFLETMITNFDDGRSRSFFCKAAALIDLIILSESLDKANRKIKTERIKQNDVKNKAKILRTILNEVMLDK